MGLIGILASEIGSIKVGRKLSWRLNSQVNIAYSDSRTTTTNKTQTEVDEFERKVSLLLKPKEKKYLYLIAFTNENDKANLMLNYKLLAKIKGEPMPGAYLKDLAEAMAPIEIKTINDQYIEYTVKGTIRSSVATNATIVVSSEEINLD